MDSSRNAAAAGILFALLGFGCVLAAEISAYARHALRDSRLILLAATFTLVAFGSGLFAQIAQLRHWSRRVRVRLLVGFPLIFLTLLAITAELFVPPQSGLRHPGDTGLSSVRPAPENGDTSLVKSGWYGELQQDGLLLVVTSFPDDARETVQFNRRTGKPVSYATLSVINLGCKTPVVLKTLEVALQLDSGATVQSLAVCPLLAQNIQANADLLKRLAVPQAIAVGTMLPDIPLCQEPGFSWNRVSAVRVALATGTLSVPGRLMSAEEKNALLLRTSKQPRSTHATNVSAEAWLKDF